MTIKELVYYLSLGAILRFHHATCEQILEDADGNEWSVDGRSYHAFLRRYSKQYIKTKNGNVEDVTLVIEWRKAI